MVGAPGHGTTVPNSPPLVAALPKKWLKKDPTRLLKALAQKAYYCYKAYIGVPIFRWSIAFSGWERVIHPKSTNISLTVTAWSFLARIIKTWWTAVNRESGKLVETWFLITESLIAEQVSFWLLFSKGGDIPRIFFGKGGGFEGYELCTKWNNGYSFHWSKFKPQGFILVNE
jgi:hypothetical protein